MKESSSDTNKGSEQQAWDNLMLAFEMWEGALWTSNHKQRGMAIASTQYARKMLLTAAQKVELSQ